jgi:hypothetical protein
LSCAGTGARHCGPGAGGKRVTDDIFEISSKADYENFLEACAAPQAAAIGFEVRPAIVRINTVKSPKKSPVMVHVTMVNRPISAYRFPRRALTLCPQLCMGIQPDARFPARSADALPATLYGHLPRRYTEIGLLHLKRYHLMWSFEQITAFGSGPC